LRTIADQSTDRGPERHGPRRRRSAVPALALAFLIALPAPPALAQEDSVTVSAGARYGRSPELAFLLGSGYRELWTTPIRVPALRPDTFAGGLTVLRRGSGLQTASLRFRAADGGEYVFRSLDKDQAGGLPGDLRNTLVSRLVQDQVSAKHPGAALVVAPILEAAGVPHPTPRLVVLLDHPSLGEHRREFGGMLGTLEERPEEAEGGGRGFGGFARIVGSDALLERIEESARDRVDARSYLRARLVDLLVGDWDRHPDQWRWGLEERGPTRFWVPIPRDRDNAFSHFDGVVATVGGAIRPNVVRFEERYTNLYGLVHNAQRLDRRILPELAASVWDSTAADLRARISDGVIAAAVRRMPPEYVSIGGPALEAKLRARRDSLPEVARALYALLATEVDVHGTDEDDRAEIVRAGDGSVHVRLASGASGEPYFERRFRPGETREVRVYLRGGQDHARVEGAGSAITVRVIGGGGDDLLEDRSPARRGAPTLLYDDRGSNRFVTGPGTGVDVRPFTPPGAGSAAENNAPPPRDWGDSRSGFAPRAEWRSMIGPVVGGGPVWSRHGFRRFPFATRRELAVLYAPLHGKFGAEGELRRIHTGGRAESTTLARASQIHLTRLHGFGNETPRAGGATPSRVWTTEYSLRADVTWVMGEHLRVGGGPLFAYRVPSVDGDPAVAELPGGDAYALAGLGAHAALERGEAGAVPRHGFRLRAHVATHPLVRGEGIGPFHEGGGSAVGYVPLPGPLEPTLALRAVATAVSEEAPLQHGAFLGGSSSLRGFHSQRFAGDAALSGGAELRATLVRANLLLARGELGALAFLDAGRVFVRGERSSRIHSGRGAGVWFATLDRSVAAHLAVGFGEGAVVHAGLGLPF
jgi:hypothetical protein